VGVAILAERAVLREGHGDPGARLRALVDAVPAVRARLDGIVPDDVALACGPLRVRASAIHRERAVLVGDAAGYVDAITGEGMTLALRTAADAAGAIAAVLREDVAPAVAFARHARARAAVFRDHAILTHGLVWLARHPPLARRAVARLARDPALFGRLLAVNDGSRSLWSLPLLDALKLAVGSRPAAAPPAPAGVAGSAASHP
jgi:flavin-dependent dehydrogenase